MTISTRLHRSRWSVVGLGASLLLLGTGVGLQGMKSADSRPNVAPSAPTTLDPRLVLHRHTVPFSATLDRGVALNGTLWPGLPGLNTLSLSILLPGRQVARGGGVSLVVSMPGMPMVPVHATLTASGQAYRGRAILPMFGSYRARVDASTASGRYKGALSLTLPLTLAARPTSDDSARP
jgi:hypothetical protein